MADVTIRCDCGTLNRLPQPPTDRPLRCGGCKAALNPEFVMNRYAAAIVEGVDASDEDDDLDFEDDDDDDEDDDFDEEDEDDE